MATQANNVFEGLQDTIGGLTNVLREADGTLSLDVPRLLLIRFREDVVLVADFVDVISDQLVNYVIPLAKRRRAAEQGASSASGGDQAAATRLHREAVRLLIKYNEANTGRYGEIGELISYCVAVHFLKAPQIGSKMALKTSAQMPVHGVDGIHARAEDDGTVTFFALESKVIPSATDATREFCKSAAKYQGDRAAQLNELRIASDLSNLDALEGAQREAAKAFFNLYSDGGESLRRRERSVGTLVYSEDAYQNRLPVGDDMDIHERNAMSLCAAKHPSIAKTLSEQARAASLDLGKCIIFMIAVPDVNELKRVFAQTNGHVRD
jgi:hypothetical protein